MCSFHRLYLFHVRFNYFVLLTVYVDIIDYYTFKLLIVTKIAFENKGIYMDKVTNKLRICAFYRRNLSL